MIFKPFRPRHTVTYLSLGLFCFTSIGYAATPTFVLPSSVDAARVGEVLNPPIAPVASPRVIAPGFTPQTATPEALRTKFLLKELIITGSSVYGNQQLANTYRAYVGHQVSLADLQDIADSITLKYRKDGYILSRAVIPAQDISNGVVTIRVVEGYINHVTIEGTPKGARKLLEAYGKQLEKNRPLNFATLERYALLANDIPGISVKTILRSATPPANVMAPSGITPGGVDVTFVAAESTASGYASYDNRGTRFLGPHEYTVSANLNSIFRSGDQTGFQALTTTDFQELRYINLFTQQPIGDNGTTLNLSYAYTRTQPGFILEPLGEVGISKEVIANLNYPAIRSHKQTLYLNGMFDYLNNNANLTAFQVNLFNDQIRSLRVGATDNFSDNLAGINQASTQLSQGLPIMGASSNGSPHLSRIGGQSNYTKFGATASRLQNLGHNFSILAAAQGQYAFTPLLSAEQIGYGGAQFGQAYDPSEITGDHGIEGRAELRYDQIIDVRALRGIEYFTFYDIGKVWNRLGNTGQLPEASGSSTGLGLRTSFTNFLAGSLEIAFPLTRNVATQGNKAARVFFSISVAGDTPADRDIFAPTLSPTPAVANSIASYNGLTPIGQTTEVLRPVPATYVAPVHTPQQTQPQQKISFYDPLKKIFAHLPRVKLPPATATTAIETPAAPVNPNHNFEGLTAVNTINAAPTITTVKPTAPVTASLPSPANNNNNTNSAGKYYTLQLMASPDIHALHQFVANQGLTSNLVNILNITRNNKEWYILTYGRYDNAHAASSAEPQLVNLNLPQKPWVRYITG